jgi:hypothetical protein
VASGNFQGNFSNAGEEALLTGSSGSEIFRFTYEDSSPWPYAADGEGFSLSSLEINPGGDPKEYEYWTLSVKKDGTPFADNILADDGNPGSTDNGSLIVYPNPTTGLIRVQLIADPEGSSIDIVLFTTTGKIVKRESIGNPGLIDLSDYGLSAGVYILKVSTFNYSARVPVVLIKQ